MKLGNVHTFWTILEFLWIISDVKGNYSMLLGFKNNYLTKSEIPEKLCEK